MVAYAAMVNDDVNANARPLSSMTMMVETMTMTATTTMAVAAALQPTRLSLLLLPFRLGRCHLTRAMLTFVPMLMIPEALPVHVATIQVLLVSTTLQ